MRTPPVTRSASVGADARGGGGKRQALVQAWGLTWNQAIEAGQLVVGDEIKFTVDVEAVAAPPEAVEQAR